MSEKDIEKYKFNNLTQEELQKLASKGGKASVEARRKKKEMRETLSMIMSLKTQGNVTETLKSFGITDEEDHTLGTLASVKLFQEVLKGGKNGINAFTVVRDTIGEKPVERVVVSEIDSDVIDELESLVIEDEDG